MSASRLKVNMEKTNCCGLVRVTTYLHGMTLVLHLYSSTPSLSKPVHTCVFSVFSFRRIWVLIDMSPRSAPHVFTSFVDYDASDVHSMLN